MITGLQKINPAVAHAIHEPVFLRKAARPASCLQVFKGLRLPNSCERFTQNVLDQIERAKRNLAVVFYPVTKILPEFRMKDCLPFTARQGRSPDGIAQAVLVYLSWRSRGGGL